MTTRFSEIEDEDELDEEPGEVIESAPPLKVGEERELNNTGIKKLLLKKGVGWETPEFNDEVTVHYVGTLLDGTKFDSTRDRNVPFTLKLGKGEVVTGLDHGVITMKKGERSLLTLPPEMGYGVAGREGVPPNSVVQFEVELVSWITVVDVTKDGGVIKKIIEKAQRMEHPGDLDEVLVKYQVTLADGTVVANTLEEGIEFHIKDDHLFPALPKAIITMKGGEKAKVIVQSQYAFGEEGKDVGNRIIHPIPPNSVVNLDLELVSFKPVVDVTGDGKVLKKILKEGEGTLVANEGASVNVSYMAKLQDGTIFEKKGVDGEQPLQFLTDEEQVISGLDRAAATMKKGEQAIITISPEYGFGGVEVKTDLATVPPNSLLVYEAEMLDFVKEKAPWEMNNQEKIEAAGRKKEEGNLLFKGEKYERAWKKYDKAADYVGEESSFGDDEEELVKALRVSCWLNSAACFLKLVDFPKAIELCSKLTLVNAVISLCMGSPKLTNSIMMIIDAPQVLNIEFTNLKALYRRAQAYIQTADLFLAELDIKKALEVDPHNREIKSLQKSLKQLQVESNKRDAKLYSKMFSRMWTDPLLVTKKLKVERVEDEKR